MNYISFIYLLLFSVLASAQQIEVIYDSKINRNNAVFSEHSDYILQIQNNQALYEPVNKDLTQHMVFSNDFIQTNESKTLLQLNSRNGSESRIVYPEMVYTDEHKDEVFFQTGAAIIWAVKEPLYNFAWDIVQNSDSIMLGFKTQKAITSYRGRVYEAWFTQEISQSFGPWKFNGLPGLILSVRSLDGYYLVDAIKLEVKSETEPIKNPYQFANVVPLDEFKSSMHEFYLNMAKNAAAKNPDGGSYRITFFGDQLEDFGIEPIAFDY